MSDSDLAFCSATQLLERNRSGPWTAREALEAVLHRIERHNPRLNALCGVLSESARAAAAEADSRLDRGEPVGPLHGVPVCVEDSIDVAGLRTAHGSRFHADRVPEHDAPLVARLRAAGALIVGRTAMSEFGWKGATESPLCGITRNPWNPDVTPGGAGGGAAAAVAAGFCPLAIGVDAGGDLRLPAAWCNVVGFKPSAGRFPEWPPSPVASVRQLGTITRTVADAALALHVLSGPDARDSFSLPDTLPDCNLGENLSRNDVRIALAASPAHAPTDPELANLCRAGARRFEELGAQVEEVDLDWKDAYETWRVLFFGALSAHLEPLLDDDTSQFDPGLLRVIVGNTVLRARDMVEAELSRREFAARAAALFETYDFLVTPTATVPPFPIGHDHPQDGDDRPGAWMQRTLPFNLTGQPAISVPCGWTADGLPAGLQIVGRRFADVALLELAHAFEQAAPWQAHPEMDWNWPIEAL